MDKIYIRLLEEGDAAISWKWRNDRKVWKYTGNKPDRQITPAIEFEWIQEVLIRESEIRFAICIKETGKYIGNVQLTSINGYDAAFHIFIGDKKSWGKGYGAEATRRMVEYGFGTLSLQAIYLDVKKDNVPALKAYRNAGFGEIFEYDGYSRMAIYTMDRVKKQVSVFVMTYNHEKFIRKALEGLLMQQVDFEYEVIIGDDFSKDDTRTILLEYARRYPGKIKLLFYPRNISALINQVWILKNCTGEYIAMCEGDDYWTDPLKMQQQFDFLENNNNYSLTFHDISMIYENDSNKIHDRLPQKDKKDYEKDELLLGAYLPTPTLFFRKFDNNRYIPAFKNAFNGDRLILAIVTQNGKTKYLPNIAGSGVRVHSGGSWSSKNVLDRWNHSLKTLQVIYSGLDSKRQEYTFENYNKAFELAIWTAEDHKSKKDWMQYSLKYISFLLMARKYGKTWLVVKRVAKRMIRQ